MFGNIYLGLQVTLLRLFPSYIDHHFSSYIWLVSRDASRRWRASLLNKPFGLFCIEIRESRLVGHTALYIFISLNLVYSGIYTIVVDIVIFPLIRRFQQLMCCKWTCMARFLPVARLLTHPINPNLNWGLVFEHCYFQYIAALLYLDSCLYNKL